MWEQEKLLVTSNFSFSHSVFKRLVLQTRKNKGLFRKGLTTKPWPFNLSPNDKLFDLSKLKAFADDKSNLTQNLKFVLDGAENIVGKEKMLVTSIFSFSYNVFKSLPSQGP